DELVLAVAAAIGEHRGHLRIAAGVIEAREPLAGDPRADRILIVEERDEGVDRRPQRVDVEAVESGAIAPGVAAAEPLDEPADVGVAPGPAREPIESGQRVRARLVVAVMADVAIDAQRILPG